MADEKIPLAGTPVYEVMSKTQVQKIVDAIFQLLRETGVAFDPDPRVMDLFSDAGCDISADHVVRFESDFVKECLDSMPKSAKIWNRDGSDFHEMREGNTVFRTSMTCIRVSSRGTAPSTTSPPSRGWPTRCRTWTACA
jgi:trimethylamine:corrinoid methyltransferase-like protein